MSQREGPVEPRVLAPEMPAHMAEHYGPIDVCFHEKSRSLQRNIP